MNKRLASFTVMELMIGLLLTSLVIGIIYFAYSMLNKKIVSYTRSSGINIEYLEFDKVIADDFDKAKSIRDTAENCLSINTEQNESIVYSFLPKVIVRTQNEVVDSFLIGVKNISVNHVDNKQNLVSDIMFETVVNEELISMAISKSYTAIEMMDTEQ